MDLDSDWPYLDGDLVAGLGCVSLDDVSGSDGRDIQRGLFFQQKPVPMIVNLRRIIMQGNYALQHFHRSMSPFTPPTSSKAFTPYTGRATGGRALLPLTGLCATPPIQERPFNSKSNLTLTLTLTLWWKPFSTALHFWWPLWCQPNDSCHYTAQNWKNWHALHQATIYWMYECNRLRVNMVVFIVTVNWVCPWVMALVP